MSPSLPFLQFIHVSQEIPCCLHEENLGVYFLQPKSSNATIYLPGILWGTCELVYLVVAMVPGTKKSWNTGAWCCVWNTQSRWHLDHLLLFPKSQSLGGPVHCPRKTSSLLPYPPSCSHPTALWLRAHLCSLLISPELLEDWNWISFSLNPPYLTSWHRR